MKKGIIVFIIGLIMLMSGIYLSTHWTIVGMLIGVSGGFIIGGSSYFFIQEKS